jgi:hypothetical protein
MRMIYSAIVLAALVGCAAPAAPGTSGSQQALRLGIGGGATMGPDRANCENQKKAKDTYPLSCTSEW